MGHHAGNGAPTCCWVVNDEPAQIRDNYKLNICANVHSKLMRLTSRMEHSKVNKSKAYVTSELEGVEVVN